MEDQAETMQQRIAAFFPGTLGVRITSANPDRVTAELDVRDDICTVPGICHGGALMAFADTLGAVATVLNIPPTPVRRRWNRRRTSSAPVSRGRRSPRSACR